jgi:hypothetical protein
MRERTTAVIWKETERSLVSDPFGIDPIRRSLGLCLVSGAVIVLPWYVSDDAGEMVMLSVGWLALTGLIFGIPVLAISLLESGVAAVRRKVRAPVEDLCLSPRVTHILRRHGFTTVSDVRRASRDELAMLANMDERGLREIERALTLVDYQLWQESGFQRPASGQGGWFDRFRTWGE